MGALAVIALTSVAIYFFFKHITERGRNAVRAYLYLLAISKGATAADANRLVQTYSTSPSSQVIRETQQYVQSVYGGKQLPMIAQARKLGFLSKGYDTQTQTPITQSHSTTALAEEELACTDFDTYNDIFIAEVKRLSGKSNYDLHWVELAEDTGTRKAFNDGVDPRALALAFYNLAQPPLH